MLTATLTILALLPGQMAKITHPAMGSPERKAILDAIRPYAYYRPTAKDQFKVDWIAVGNGRAVVEVWSVWPGGGAQRPTDEFDSEGEPTDCFLKKVNGKWKLMLTNRAPHEGLTEGEGCIYDLRKIQAGGFSPLLPKPADDKYWRWDFGYHGYLWSEFVPKNGEGAITKRLSLKDLPKNFDTMTSLRIGKTLFHVWPRPQAPKLPTSKPR